MVSEPERGWRNGTPIVSHCPSDARECLDWTIAYINSSSARHVFLGSSTRYYRGGAPEPSIAYERRLQALPRAEQKEILALVAHASRCLATLRQRLLSAEADWSLDDYELVLRVLGSRDPVKLLKMLLLAYRVAPAEGQAAPITVPWTSFMPASIREALELSVSDSLTRQIAESVPRIFARSDHHVCDWDGGEKAMQALCTTLAEHCVEKLELKRKQRSFDDGYTPEQCKEPDAQWRQGYLEALAELDVNSGGRMHRTIAFVRDNDPDDGVRETAEAVYPRVRAVRGKPKGVTDWHRNYLAAFWWIRIARAQAAGVRFDRARAERLRRQDLRQVG